MSFNLLRFREFNYPMEDMDFLQPTGVMPQIVLDVIDMDDEFYNKIKQVLREQNLLSLVTKDEFEIMNYFKKFKKEFGEFIKEKYPEKYLKEAYIIDKYFN
jgi:hypothetical protein